MPRIALAFFLILLSLTSCTPQWGSSSTQVPVATATATWLPTLTATSTATLEPGVTPSPTPPPTPTLAPDAWMSMPAVPQSVSQQMLEVYARGLVRGRDPRRFSKFGDCQNVTTYFLSMFDTGDYRLGDYESLQATIDQFDGSWARESSAVKGGMNVAAVQTLYFTDPQNCGTNQSPMACEIDRNNPSIVLMSFETWWDDKPASDYESRLRSVVDFVLAQDVVPILGTKADNLEGDNAINAAIARVAYEYGIPLWNFWAASQLLDGRGLLEDGFHLTGLGTHSYFDDPQRMKMAWPWRNLTALQSIDAVYRALNNLP